MILHFVAHTLPGTYPLSTVDVCWRLWWGLRRAIDRVFAACLMPNHLHLIAVARNPFELRQRIVPVLVGIARSLGCGPVWQRVPLPEVIADPGKLSRDIRYVLLNAMRAGFHDDPACHAWSTYRDVIGATLDPWVDVADLAAVLGHALDGFVDWFHGYVSGDPSVAVGGTALPLPAPARADMATPLDRIAAAASAVAATALCADRQRAFIENQAYVLGARHQGWSDATRIAAARSMSVQTVRRLARSPDDALLRAARFYIGDERLLATPRFRRAA